MDRVVSGAVEFHVTYDIVVLDFCNGLIVPGVLALPIDFQRIIEPARSASPYQGPTAGIRWADTKTLEVTFRAENPKLLSKTRFRLTVTPDGGGSSTGAGFFDLAETVDSSECT